MDQFISSFGIFIIILLLLALIIGLPILLAKLNSYKNKSERTSRQYKEARRENEYLSQQYSQVRQNFVSFQHTVQQEKELEKEVAKRRRVKASDKNSVFERDGYTCQICGISQGFLDDLCEGLGDYLLLEIDHIQSVEQGGDGTDINNLQCLCWRCNRKKGGKKTNEQVRSLIDYGINKLRLRS